MWIKSESGRIYNLSHAQVVEIYKLQDDEHVVLARFCGTNLKDAYGHSAGSDLLVAELTSPKTEKEARKIIDHIGQALEMKEAFIDLTRPAV